jgi:hypothetical protein
MAKLTLSTISSRYGSIDALNANFDAVEAALENTLSLDGTAPNGLEVDLDMNSHKVINLADPTNNGDAVSRGWLLEQEGNAVASATAAAASASAAENSAVAAAASASVVAPQTGNSGKFLTTNGSATSWAVVDALPSQTGNSGEYLTTDGTTASWAAIVSGTSISNDTSTATNLYPLFASATSGVPTTIYTGNTKLLYKPSTGEFQSSIMNAGNGIYTNSQTVAASYTIASGTSGMSAGPITIASGQSVTVSSGSRWIVL